MDDIRKAISRLKAELREKPPVYLDIMTKCPAVIPALGVMAGIICRYYWQVSLLWWLIGCAVASAIFFIINRYSKNYHIRAKILLVIFCFACVGAIRLADFQKPSANDIRNITQDRPERVHIRARIITAPLRIDPKNRLTAEFSITRPYTVFYAKAIQVKTHNGWADISGKIKFYAGGDYTDLKSGDKIQSYCKIKTFSGADNPGQSDYKKMMNRRGIYVSASVKNASSIQVLESGSNGIFSKIQSKLRQLTLMGLRDDMDSGETAGLLDALILGRRERITPDVYNAFQKTGLLHLISLSGLHVGIFAGLVWWIGKKSGLIRVHRAVLCIFALIIFVIIVPARTPAIRAVIMFLTFYLAQIYKKRTNAFNSLAFAAIIVLLIRPTDIFSAGFALSFAAVAGIMLLYPPLSQIINAKLKNVRPALLGGVLTALADALIVSFSAWIATAGILVFYFYKIQPAGMLWTAAALPFVIVILPLGLLKIIFAAVAPSVSSLLAIPLGAVAGLFTSFVKTLAALGPAPIVTGKVPLLLILAYYGILIYLIFPAGKYKRLKPALCTAGILALVLLPIGINSRTEANTFSLEILSVGHGQCAVAELNGSRTVIFDCGSLDKNDVGERIVLPYLNYAGIKKIDYAYLSHNDIDHFNGIPEVIEAKKISQVYLSQKFIAQTKTSNTASALADFLEHRGITEKPCPQLTTLAGVKIIRLWPENNDTKKLSDNDSADVMLVEYAGRKIMLCSDIGKYAQQKIVELYPNLHVDVLISPHHGSLNSSLPGFANTFSPEYIITSCAWYQYQKITKFCKNSSRRFFTNICGAINIRINSAGRLTITPFK